MRYTTSLLASSPTTDSSSLRRRDLRALRRVVRTPIILPSFSRQENAPTNSHVHLLFLRSADGYSLRTRREFVSALSTIPSRYNLPFNLSNIRLHSGFPEFDDITFTTPHFNRIRERLQGGNCFRREVVVSSNISEPSSLAEFGKLLSGLPSLFASRQSLSRELGRPSLLFLQTPGDKPEEQQSTPAVLRALILCIPTLNSFASSAQSGTFFGFDSVVPGRVFYTESPHKVLKTYFSSSWSPGDLFPKPLVAVPYEAFASLFSLPSHAASVAFYSASPLYSICSIFDQISNSSKLSSPSTPISEVFTSSK
jgi:hypothetical protein